MLKFRAKSLEISAFEPFLLKVELPRISIIGFMIKEVNRLNLVCLILLGEVSPGEDGIKQLNWRNNVCIIQIVGRIPVMGHSLGLFYFRVIFIKLGKLLDNDIELLFVSDIEVAVLMLA